jgi:hypothetical protein
VPGLGFLVFIIQWISGVLKKGQYGAGEAANVLFVSNTGVSFCSYHFNVEDASIQLELARKGT